MKITWLDHCFYCVFCFAYSCFYKCKEGKTESESSKSCPALHRPAAGAVPAAVSGSLRQHGESRRHAPKADRGDGSRL